MLKTIALIGAPNVGKSSLFNKITKTQDALVADFSGLTRDRQYAFTTTGEFDFILIDTGGVKEKEEGIEQETIKQSYLAIDEADIIVFMVSATSGINANDLFMANYLRSLNQKDKDIILFVNKADNDAIKTSAFEFYELGFENVFIGSVLKTSLKNIQCLLNKYLEKKATSANENENIVLKKDAIKLAIIGRPNVGKSTFVNSLLGVDRQIVFDEAGTTRDSIYLPFEFEKTNYTLIDTAGLKRKKNTKIAIEKFSSIKAMRAISDANVVLLMLDASVGIHEQDITILSYILKAGRALVLVFNKSDLITKEEKKEILNQLQRRLEFLTLIDIYFICAIKKINLKKIFFSVDTAFASATAKIKTNKITNLLLRAQEKHPAPLHNGKRIKLKYAHLGGSNPPRIIIYGNQLEKLAPSYKRYLENYIKTNLNLRGTPIVVEFRKRDNPYAKN